MTSYVDVNKTLEFVIAKQKICNIMYHHMNMKFFKLSQGTINKILGFNNIFYLFDFKIIKI